MASDEHPDRDDERDAAERAVTENDDAMRRADITNGENPEVHDTPDEAG
jgi:hypothetical protein